MSGAICRLLLLLNRIFNGKQSNEMINVVVLI